MRTNPKNKIHLKCISIPSKIYCSTLFFILFSSVKFVFRIFNILQTSLLIFYIVYDWKHIKDSKFIKGRGEEVNGYDYQEDIS